MNLQARLILSYILIIFLCLSIAAAALLLLLQGYRDRVATARLTDMSAPINVQLRAVAQGRVSLDQQWANLEELSEETGIFLLLLNSQGNIIKQASPEGTQIEPPPNISTKRPLRDRLRPQRGTYTTSDGQKLVFVAYPLGGLFKTAGPNQPETLILAMPRTGAQAALSELAKPFLWAALIALIVSIVISALIARSVYRPIQHVTTAAEKITRGEYDHEVPVAGPEEIKGLARRFNQMSMQVKQAQQTLRDFVADAAHELKSPLTSIRGFAQAIIDGTAKDKEAQFKAASIIEDEATRMMRLVNDLLELSKLESGQVNIAREPVNMKDLLQYCQDIFSIRAEEKNVHLSTDIQTLPFISGDIDRLEQVFNNLLDNAIKHAPPGGSVSIVTNQSSINSIEVSITDSGPGMSPEQMSHIFERFYRVDASSTKSGTGLGLAIAHEIIRAHNGIIQVKSAVGRGTEFLVRLPVRKESAL